MTDYISRADAMGAVQDHFNADGFKGYDDGQKMMDRIKALPSVVEVKEEKMIKAEWTNKDSLDLQPTCNQLATNLQQWTGDIISRADAIEAVCRTRCGDKAKGCPAHSCLVIEEFDALPSADAEKTYIGIDIPYGSDKRIATIFKRKDDKLILEEVKEIMSVVRCKDCKHYIVEGITTQYGWCHEYKHSVNEDDYCSYGERKK